MIIKKLIIFNFIVIFGISSISAQNKSFSLNDSFGTNYKEISSLKLNETFTSKNAKRFRPLFINPIVQTKALIAVNDTILLDLFVDKRYKAYIDKITVDVNGTLTIRARLVNYSYGYCVISTYNGQSLITITVPETNELFMSYFDRPTNNYFLLQIDKSRQKALEGSPPLIPTSDDQQNNNSIQKIQYNPLQFSLDKNAKTKSGNILNDESTPDIITVMIVYTPAAAAWAIANETDINNTIGTLMANAQLTLDNSNTLVTMQLVHSEQVSYTEFNNDNDLFNLTNTTDGYMDNVHSLRNTYCADLVVLLEDIDYTGGQAWILTSVSGSPSHAFSLTRVQQASWTLTSIHEMAHNMGCGHHKLQLGSTWLGLFSYSAGWRWTGTDAGKYCSVMTYEDGSFFADGIDHIQVPYFSNPDIPYQGVATGNATDGDNARTIRQIKSVIAAYRMTIKLDVKVMLEGAANGTGTMNTGIHAQIQLTQPYHNITPWFYTGAESVPSIPAGVVDWVLVELRQAPNPASATSATILVKRAAFLKSNGSIVDLDGTSLLDLGNPTITDNLYIVVRHRNHLAILSANPAALSSGVYSYDFTTGLAQAYGSSNGYKMAGSKAVMVAGDIDHDGNIYVSDYNLWATAFGSTAGYYNSDLDMDSNVFVSDYNKWAANFGSTIDNRIKSSRSKPKYFSGVPK